MSKKYPFESKSWNLYRGMSLYKRKDSPRFYGCLRINGKYYRKCLNTENRNEGEELLFQWKNELLSDPDSPVSEENQTFGYFSKKLVKKEKTYPPTSSGYYMYRFTENILNRENGLLEYFGNTDIRSLKTSDVDNFITQLPLKKKLTKSTVKQHLNVLRKVLNMGDVRLRFPRLNGSTLKSQRRGFFNKEEYRELRDKSLEFVGHEYKLHNGTTHHIDRDLHDLIVFMVGSSLRPTISEIYSVQHKHITVKETKKKTKYLEFPLNRKNQTMMIQTLPTSYYSYRDLCKRRKNYDPEDYVFYPRWTNRQHCMSMVLREFKELLEQIGMRYSQNGEKRTLYSLRHTSIIFNISQPGVDLMDICRRSDTSLKMIHDWYYPESQLDMNLPKFLREEKLSL